MLTELGGSQVEVQRCSLSSDGPRLRSSGGSVSSEGPRLRSSGAHCPRLRSSGAQCAQTLAVEVQQCPLRAEVGEELARRKWTWKWRQSGGGGGGGGGRGEEEEGGEQL